MGEIDNELIKIREKKAELLKNAVIEPAHPTGIVHVESAKHFSELVQENPATLFLVDFTATWCGPCKMFAPIFQKLQGEFGADVIFLKLDVDEVPEIANYFQISGVPTTVFFAKNKEIYRRVGVASYQEMVTTIKNALEKL